MSYSKHKTEKYSNLKGINTKISLYTDTEEFRDLSNVNFAVPGALTKRPGTASYIGATVSGAITGLYEYEKLSGASYVIATANTNAYVVASPFTTIKASLQNGAIFDFVTFVDHLFAANGTDFFKFDGTNTSSYSLPAGLTGSWGVTAVIGGGLSGTFQAAYGYLNSRGYLGPMSQGITIALNGITFGSIGYFGLTSPSGFGITAIALYRTNQLNTDLFGTTYAPSSTVSVTDTGFTLTSTLGNDNLYFTMAPKYMEIYNNQLFMAGFSGFLSTAYWSEIGEPEGVDPTFNAEFRTNDGDQIRGLKTYEGSLIVAKERSFHRIVGDNPSNFLLQEISDQYGCVSNRTMITFENNLLFLDPKGVVQYTGANITMLSNPIEPIFQRMNLSAARENAVGIHYREYNEVWFAIPVDGSSVNNMILVYDYLVGAWTKYEGITVSALALAKGTLSKKTILYGGYTGSISNFGPSYYADNGQAMTCLISTRYMAPMGESVQEQYRRFFLNVDPVIGITQAITCNFRTNFGSSIQLTRTMYQNPFQSRIDFGLSAKSLSVEMTQVSASLPFKVYGWTVESRLQRPV
jgi:hypothetical protein